MSNETKKPTKRMNKLFAVILAVLAVTLALPAAFYVVGEYLGDNQKVSYVRMDASSNERLVDILEFTLEASEKEPSALNDKLMTEIRLAVDDGVVDYEEHKAISEHYYTLYPASTKEKD